MCTQCSLQLPETNTLYMQCILGVIIIIWLKNNDNYKVMFYFLSPNVLLLFVFKNPHEMFSFSSEIMCCVSGYQTKAYNINFIYL